MQEISIGSSMSQGIKQIGPLDGILVVIGEGQDMRALVRYWTVAAVAYCGLFLLASNGVHASLIGLSSNFGDDGNKLWSISETTGAATQTAALNVGQASFVGLAELGGTLFASDVFLGSGPFVRISPSGGVTGISNQGGSVNWHALAPNEAAGFLYTVNLDAPGRPLLKVTPGGAITSIGSTGQNIRGLAFDNSTGKLYGSDGSILYLIDTSTGVSTVIGSMGLPLNDLLDLAFDQDLHKLFLVEDASSGLTSLYNVNTGTGAATLVGSTGHKNIDGLAWVSDATSVPEPGTLTLLGGGLLGLGWLRRRKPRIS